MKTLTELGQFTRAPARETLVLATQNGAVPPERRPCCIREKTTLGITREDKSEGRTHTDRDGSRMDRPASTRRRHECYFWHADRPSRQAFWMHLSTGVVQSSLTSAMTADCLGPKTKFVSSAACWRVALPTPPCICPDSRTHTPISAIKGSQETSSRYQPEDHRPRHARLLRRRPDEPRQRSGADCRAAQQAQGNAGRVIGSAIVSGASPAREEAARSFCEADSSS
jgi:hypothetical protein